MSVSFVCLRQASSVSLSFSCLCVPIARLAAAQAAIKEKAEKEAALNDAKAEIRAEVEAKVTAARAALKDAAEKLGTIAADRLIEQIEHPRTVILDREIVTGSLQEGGTVGEI